MNPIWFPIAQATTGGSRDIVDKLARTPLSQVVFFVSILTVLRCALFFLMRRRKANHKSVRTALTQFANEILDSLVFAGVLVFMLIRPFGVQAFVIPTGSMWPELPVNAYVVANKLIYRYTDPKINDVVVFHPPKEGAIGPDDLDSDGELKFDFVKRCIGTPGDMIEIKNGILFRNGKRVDEDYRALSVCLDDPNHCQNYRMLTADERKHLMYANFKLVKFHGQIVPLNFTDVDANAPVAAENSVTVTERPYFVAERYQLPKRADQMKAVRLPAERIPAGMYLMMGDNRNNSFDGRGWGLVSRDRIVGRSECVWWPLSKMHVTR
jgi:signal peptidase I